MCPAPGTATMGSGPQTLVAALPRSPPWRKTPVGSTRGSGLGRRTAGPRTNGNVPTGGIHLSWNRGRGRARPQRGSGHRCSCPSRSPWQGTFPHPRAPRANTHGRFPTRSRGAARAGTAAVGLQGRPRVSKGSEEPLQTPPWAWTEQRAPAVPLPSPACLAARPQQHPARPSITQQHPASPNCTQQHPAWPSITQQHPAAPSTTPDSHKQTPKQNMTPGRTKGKHI